MDKFNTVFTPFVDKGVKFLKKSLTSQEFKDEADINSIMRKYKTIDNYNALHPGRVAQPQYGDFSQMKGDYMKALATVANANEAFALLPAEVRAKFNNNPAEAIKFAGSKDNQEVAIALGLVPQPVKKEAGSEQLPHIASAEPASVDVKTEA